MITQLDSIMFKSSQVIMLYQQSVN